MKKLLSTLLAAGMILSTAGMFSGCSDSSEGLATSGKLVFTIWDNNLMEYIEANDMEGNSAKNTPTRKLRWKKSKTIPNTGTQ